MGRLTGIVHSNLVEWTNDVLRSWNEFWFRPADPTLLGMIRIFAGLMLVYTHAVWGLELEAFFGPNAWLSAEMVGNLQADQTVFSYWWWIPQEGIWPAHIMALIVLSLFTLGIATRVTAVMSFLIVVSYAYRTPAALFGLDQINAMLTLYCAIGPSGSALSVDRLISRFRSAREQLANRETNLSLRPQPSVGANMSLRLIQIHMCVIYFFAGISKLQGTAWWNGEAMWLAFANLEYQSMDMTWLARHPWLINLMSHTTILWEISFPALIWLPRWRPVMLFCGIMMHLGIGACLGMWTFGLIMLVGCASFLPPQIPRFLAELLFAARTRGILIFDGSCRVCQQSVAWWKAFDVADRIEVADCLRTDPTTLAPQLQDGDCLRDIHFVKDDHSCQTGYEARQSLLWTLPLLWPVAIATAIPGLRKLSRIVFEKKRNRAIEQGACGASMGQWREPGTTVSDPAGIVSHDLKTQSSRQPSDSVSN